MTLDGFIARPNDEIDWVFKYADDEMSKEIMADIGAVVMGNSRYYPDENSLPYGGQVKVPQFVVTHKLRESITVGGLTFAFVNSIERCYTC
jgi:dihydrofolate reductase